MKPEPLKDKEWWLFHIYNEEAHRIRKQKKQQVASLKGFVDKDIKSAVEWLKMMLKRDLEIQLKAGRKGQAVKLGFALHLIDEAFEDVTKK